MAICAAVLLLQVMKACGGVGPDVVIDFVGGSATSQFSLGLLLAKTHVPHNGKYIVVGLLGGEIQVQYQIFLLC